MIFINYNKMEYNLMDFSNGNKQSNFYSDYDNFDYNPYFSPIKEESLI